MKKIKFLVAALSVFALTSSVASAYDFHPYVGASTGWSVGSDQKINGESIPYNGAFNITGAVGTKLYENFRVEEEFGYQNVSPTNSSSIGKASAYTILTNGYGDFFSKGITPFVTGGLGVGIYSPNSPSTLGSKTVFAWQAGCGVTFPVTDTVFIDTTYRHTGFSKVNYDVASSTPYSNAFLLGVRVGI